MALGMWVVFCTGVRLGAIHIMLRLFICAYERGFRTSDFCLVDNLNYSVPYKIEC